MKITYYHRKPRPAENFSIEAYFKDIRKHLSKDIQWQVAESTFYSNGFFRRLYNALEAVFRQGDVNHITGDTHYLSIFLKKRKTILTIHDCGFMQHPSPLARILLRWFWLRLPVMRSKIVTAVSEATKKDIIQYTGCSTDKIKVVPTSIHSRFQPCPKSFNTEKPILLQIGSAPNKNLERLVEAIHGISCHLEIVGKLPIPIQKKLNLYNIEYTSTYNLSDEEMLQKYHSCDILVFASTLEGFGMPIIEANAVERPVVTSNISSMPEVANDAACLVNPYDVASIRTGILRIIMDSKYREQLIRNGRINRERYRAQHIAKQYEQVYYEMC